MPPNPTVTDKFADCEYLEQLFHFWYDDRRGMLNGFDIRKIYAQDFKIIVPHANGGKDEDPLSSKALPVHPETFS